MVINEVSTWYDRQRKLLPQWLQRLIVVKIEPCIYHVSEQPLAIQFSLSHILLSAAGGIRKDRPPQLHPCSTLCMATFKCSKGGRLFSHATLRLRNTMCRQHPPQRKVLSHIYCFGEHKVVVSQILLDEPRDVWVVFFSPPERKLTGSSWHLRCHPCAQCAQTE